MAKKRSTDYKCKYYHEICSRCINWPNPEDIEQDYADDCCTELTMAVYYMKQEELAKTGHCKYFEEF